MPCLRGQRPEAHDLTHGRGLTARPAVLAKTYEPEPSCFPSYGMTARAARYQGKLFLVDADLILLRRFQPL